MLSPEEKYPMEKTTKAVIFLKNFIKNPNIQIGDYTYYDGRGNPEKFETENVIFGYTSRLLMGKFCQIAYGTKFLLSDANHQISGFSTFPFFAFGSINQNCPEWNEYEPDLPDKGDTIVGNDVWFGHESMIMPGVNIGNGVIIAARSVVTKDIPPYSIVGGNPAKILKMRFSDDVVANLQKIQWWNWDYDKITRNIKIIVSANIEKLQKAE